jgi:flagellar hook-basal body complex protein FliE
MQPITGPSTAAISTKTLEANAAQATPATADGPSFKNFLLDSIQQVNSMQQQADRSVEGLFTGQDVNPAEVLTAVQKADLAFRMMMQVRNKLVQVYQEVKDIRI